MARAAKSGGSKGSGRGSRSKPGAGRASRAAADPAVTPVPPDSVQALSAAQIEEYLETGERQGELEDYFGPERYDELRRLAQSAGARSVRGGDKVLILPGIMGSKIGRKRPLLDDVIWASPIDLAAGRLAELALPPPKAPVRELDVILVAYLSLKLRLKIAGFDADFFPYDWRKTLPTLGKELAKKVQDERAGRPNGKLYLVAHSMGGLVSRASLPHLKAAGVKAPDRIVMLGTPNFGSYAPVQAFRGASGTVQKIAKLDQVHSKAELAGIFGGFSGLLEMIPSPKLSQANLFDLSNWPDSGVKPAQAMLTAAGKVQAALPTEHPDIVMICGVNRDTVVDARIEQKEFVYTLSKEGDGTVPLALARIPTAAQTYFVEEDHGALPGNGRIQSALPSILATGHTSELPSTWNGQRGGLHTVRERDLWLEEPTRSAGLPSVREQRHLLDEFVAPAPISEGVAVVAAAAAGSAAPPDPLAEPFSPRVVVGRSRQQRLDITLARGDITEADAACYVVGLFQNVTPGGAAGALDAVMHGALSEMVARRMFGANVGEISILPKGRHPLRAQSVAFAGLGAFDRFDEAALEVVGENLVRTFLAARIDDFAVVPLGASSGTMTLRSLRHLMAGFLRGLKDADTERRFRGITICEKDEARYLAIRNELFRLSPTALFDDVELVFSEAVLPEPAIRQAAVRKSESQKVYLIVRQDYDREGNEGFTSSLLTAGSAAAIESGRVTIEGDQLNAHLQRLQGVQDMDAATLAAFGRRLGELVLPKTVLMGLDRNLDQHLVLVHDPGASRVPWETLCVAGGFPAEKGGLSHRYEAADFSVAKWLQTQQQRETLSVLLIVDPTKYLAGAREEGARIEEVFKSLGSSVRYRRLYQDEARKQELLRCFSSGEFDVVHYAGHAFFDPQMRSRSGLLCAGDEVLSGADLAGVGNLPSLMFFNACEAARVRRPEDKKPMKSAAQVERNTSFAESLLRGGVANFLGTYWPVGDAPAKTFGETFYKGLLGGRTLNRALLDARAAVRALRSPDWADYVFYGDPDFQVKTSRAPPGEFQAGSSAST